jgi:hypothetical protein
MMLPTDELNAKDDEMAIDDSPLRKKANFSASLVQIIFVSEHLSGPNAFNW